MRNFWLHGITEIVISDLPHYRPRHAPYCPCPPTSLVFNPEHCHLILPIFVSSFAYHYAFLYFTLGIETISNFLQSSAGLAEKIPNNHYKLQLKIYIQTVEWKWNKDSSVQYTITRHQASNSEEYASKETRDLPSTDTLKYVAFLSHRKNATTARTGQLCPISRYFAGKPSVRFPFKWRWCQAQSNRPEHPNQRYSSLGRLQNWMLEIWVFSRLNCSNSGRFGGVKISAPTGKVPKLFKYKVWR